ncbi:hypothetical protein MHB73_21250 [Bacillus sp. FSL K6-6483]
MDFEKLKKLEQYRSESYEAAQNFLDVFVGAAADYAKSKRIGIDPTTTELTRVSELACKGMGIPEGALKEKVTEDFIDFMVLLGLAERA